MPPETEENGGYQMVDSLLCSYQLNCSHTPDEMKLHTTKQGTEVEPNLFFYTAAVFQIAVFCMCRPKELEYR